MLGWEHVFQWHTYPGPTLRQKKNYVQIGKELLAIVFVVSKFYQYVFGAQVITESYHKLLEVNFVMATGMARVRMQIMLL